MLVYVVIITILTVSAFAEMLTSSGSECLPEAGTGLRPRTVKKAYNPTYGKNVRFYFCALCLIFVFVMQATNMGVDADNYQLLFSRVQRYSFVDCIIMAIRTGKDAGYYALNKLISFFTADYWLFRAIIHVITLFNILFVIKKESENAPLSMLIFFAIFQGNVFYILRMSLSVSLVFLGYYFMKRGKNFWFFLLVAIASTIHISALISLVIPLVYYCKKRRFDWLEIFLGMAFSVVVAYVLLPVAVSAYRNEYVIGSFGSRGLRLFVVLLVAVFLIDSCARGLNGLRTKADVFEFNMICCSLFGQAAALFVGVFTRARDFFTIFAILYIPRMFACVNNPKNRFLAFGGLVIVLCVWLFVISSVYPYEFHKF